MVCRGVGAAGTLEAIPHLRADCSVFREPTLGAVKLGQLVAHVSSWTRRCHREGGTEYPFIPEKGPVDDKLAVIRYLHWPEWGDAVVPRGACKGEIEVGNDIWHRWPVNNRWYKATVLATTTPPGTVRAHYLGKWDDEMYDQFVPPSQVEVQTMITGAIQADGKVSPLSDTAIACIMRAGPEAVTAPKAQKRVRWTEIVDCDDGTTAPFKRGRYE